jgi:hypothetical protein
MTPEQAAAVERYLFWMSFWQVYIADDLVTLNLPAELVAATHCALTELTTCTTIFATTAAGLVPVGAVAQSA